MTASTSRAAGSPAPMPSVPLDPDQRAAVDHREGACLVLAGPGSGKTRVIVERFLELCAAGASPSEQLVLTYTVKAAAEMRQRAEALHGPFGDEAPLTNFHAFGRRVLRQWGWRCGVPPTFHIADAAERWLHLEAVLAELRPRTLWNPLRPHDLVGPLLRLIEHAKQELITPEEYADWARRRRLTVTDEVEQALLERHAECAELHARLQERHRRLAVLDHDDCILVAERLLREDPAARRAVCDRIRFVMVDEYQDTNYAQARLVETLVAGHGNVLVVADDDQAIYKFRGASLANLQRFRRLHPGHRTVTLRRNYRSTRQIVAACSLLIAAAAPESRIAKDLVASRGDGPTVEVWEAPDERSETLAVAAECRRLLEGGMRGADIAWLFRRHDDMRAAMTALQESGVPYQVHGGRGYFRQPEIKALLALLRAVDDPTDSQSLLRCLQLPAWSVSNRGRVALVRACDASETPLCDALLGGGVPGLDAVDAEAARRAASEVVALHGRALTADVREICFDALERSGFLGVTVLGRDLERIQAGANLNKFAELLDGFADWSEDLRLRAALRYLEVLRDSGAADELAAIEPIEDGVVVLTAHAAKGLEWPVVVVGGCVDPRWPGRGGAPAALTLPDELVPEPPPPGDGVVDEERRLFYVAATRARDRLILSRARRYPRSYGDEAPTRFLAPLAGAPVSRAVEIPRVPAAPAPRTRPRGSTVPVHVEVSVADLRDFRECPRRYEYRRRYRMPARTSVQTWYGVLVHAVLEQAARRRLSGEAVDAARLVELWHQGWDAAHGPKGAHRELRAHGEESLRRYARTPAWTEARVAAVERPFALVVDAGEVRGRFDRVDDRVDGVPTVVDYKTGPPRSVESTARDLQVRAYAVALAQQRGGRVAVELHHLQTAETARVVLEAGALRRAHAHLGLTATDLSRAWNELDFPPNPAPWRCRRCDYRTICDEGGAARPAVGAVAAEAPCAEAVPVAGR
jgi:ATP-dependent DNA helicase UvrD/PcrA